MGYIELSIGSFIAGCIGGYWLLSWFVVCSFFALLIAVLWSVLQKHEFEVSIRSCFLGFLFMTGFVLYGYLSTCYAIFGVYVSAMGFFHYSEYLATALTNPSSLSLDSFLLNHSAAYGIAACLCVFEFFFESWFWPGMKTFRWMSAIGFLLICFGEFVRKAAMFTAQTNFNHIVQMQRHPGHVLVTHGVYSYCRHPAYVGWFCWSVGTQVLLCNPVCVVGYAVAAWRFFNERINIEEITLLNFFREDYLRYQQNVPTGIPFIKGYV